MSVKMAMLVAMAKAMAMATACDAVRRTENAIETLRSLFRRYIVKP